MDRCIKMGRRYQVSLASSLKNELADHSRHKSRLMQSWPVAAMPFNPWRLVQVVYLTKDGFVHGNSIISSQTWSDSRSSNDLEYRLGYNLVTVALADTV
jgi:hypothetical protein